MLAYEVPEETRAPLALAKLCAELFDADELRRWARHHLEPNIVLALPGGSASAAEVFEKFAEVVKRHGHLDEVTAEFQRIREERHQKGRGVRARSSAVHDVSHGRAAPSLAVTVALAGTWALTRGYPSLDISAMLRGLEESVFGFLPQLYRHLGLPVLMITSAICTLLLHAAKRRTTRPRQE